MSSTNPTPPVEYEIPSEPMDLLAYSLKLSEEAKALREENGRYKKALEEILSYEYLPPIAIFDPFEIAQKALKMK